MFSDGETDNAIARVNYITNDAAERVSELRLQNGGGRGVENRGETGIPEKELTSCLLVLNL